MRYVLDILTIISIVVAALVLYHVRFVVPATTLPPPIEIYVVDMDTELKAAKQQAVRAMWAGEEVDVEQLIKNVRKEMARKLLALPPNAIVLDKSVVLKGGVPVEMVNPNKM